MSANPPRQLLPVRDGMTSASDGTSRRRKRWWLAWRSSLGTERSVQARSFSPSVIASASGSKSWGRTHGLIRRLELQAHLGDEGEDDLCPTQEFPARWQSLQERMAWIGILPPEEPSYVRVDPAVDVAYVDPLEAQRVMEGLRHARWPYRWYAEWQGPPPYTTVAIKSGRKIIGRVYCRNTKTRNGLVRWGKLRFEREQRFEWKDRRPVAELQTESAASTFWGSVFGLGAASGTVRRIEREVQTVKLIERAQLGELSTAQYEQLTGFLDAERLGLTDRVYNAETARRRRALARKLGIAVADSDTQPLDISLDDLLVVPRSGWVT